MLVFIASVGHRHGIAVGSDMKNPLLGVARWMKVGLVIVVVSSVIDHAASKSPTRADARSNLSSDRPSAPDADPFAQAYAKQGDRLTLDCSVNINFSTVVWLKDGQIVQTVLRDGGGDAKRVAGHRFLVDAGGHLVIDNVRLEDDGRWQCEAEDAFGFVVQGRPIQLTILDAPKKAYLMIDNRILDPGNPFIPVKENSELTVACVVDEGHPRPQLGWQLALGSTALADVVPEDVVLNLTETARERRVGARVDAHLGRVGRGHHNATLTCRVRHIALDRPLNVSALLNVQYTPSFGISREPGFGFPVREGMPVSLKCDVDANPGATPVWRKDDGEPPVAQSADGFLNFTQIRREHSGWYKCTARHRLGRFSSIGYFLNVRYETDVTQEPDFDVSELSSTGRQLEVSLGGAVQLACPTGTTGCWTRVEPSTGRLEPLGASQELRLDTVVYQEGGEYRCVAPTRDATRRLDALRNAMSVQVVVSGQPTVAPTNKSITAVYGQPLTLTMEFCANPRYTKVIWIAKDHKIYKPGDADESVIAYGITNSSEPNCHQAVLFLPKVTSSETGEYSFIVRSPKGLAEGSCHVNLTYASGYNVHIDDVRVESSSSDTARVYASIYMHVIVSILHVMIVVID